MAPVVFLGRGTKAKQKFPSKLLRYKYIYFHPFSPKRQSEEIISTFKVQQNLLFLPKSLPLNRSSYAGSNPFR